MRVFPIFPGEDNQIELVWQRRLPMRNGRHRLSLPLAALTRPNDPRHPGIENRLTPKKFTAKTQRGFFELFFERH